MLPRLGEKQVRLSTCENIKKSYFICEICSRLTIKIFLFHTFSLDFERFYQS